MAQDASSKDTTASSERRKRARDGTEQGGRCGLGVAGVHSAARMARDGVRDIGRNPGLVHHGDERRAQGMEAGASVILPHDATCAKGRADQSRRACPRQFGEEEVPRTVLLAIPYIIGERGQSTLDACPCAMDQGNDERSRLAVPYLVGLDVQELSVGRDFCYFQFHDVRKAQSRIEADGYHVREGVAYRLFLAQALRHDIVQPQAWLSAAPSTSVCRRMSPPDSNDVPFVELILHMCSSWQRV